MNDNQKLSTLEQTRINFKKIVEEANLLGAALRASRYKITVFLISVVSIVVIVGSIMYLVEGPAAGFTSIPRGVYWAIVTLTTVGYGNIVPVTPFGQTLAAFDDRGLRHHRRAYGNRHRRARVPGTDGSGPGQDPPVPALQPGGRRFGGALLQVLRHGAHRIAGLMSGTTPEELPAMPAAPSAGNATPR